MQRTTTGGLSKSAPKRKLGKSILTSWQLYVMVLPALVYIIMFHYKPMYGIIIAFKDFSMRKGITGSPWIGFENFTRLFSSYWFPIIIKNTLTLSLLNLIVGFPIPIILALLLNEVGNGRFRKTFQTISYAPHFISIVVLCGMLVIFTNPTHGIINMMEALEVSSKSSGNPSSNASSADEEGSASSWELPSEGSPDAWLEGMEDAWELEGWGTLSREAHPANRTDAANIITSNCFMVESFPLVSKVRHQPNSLPSRPPLLRRPFARAIGRPADSCAAFAARSARL